VAGSGYFQTRLLRQEESALPAYVDPGVVPGPRHHVIIHPFFLREKWISDLLSLDQRVWLWVTAIVVPEGFGKGMFRRNRLADQGLTP
jgi:hypothetical protein